MNRRSFLKRGAVLGGSLAVISPFEALGLRLASGQSLAPTQGYGELVLKGDLWLPAEFNYQVISRQGKPMINGDPTPGLFDGMAAFPGTAGTTILIRNHENRDRAGELKVMTPPALQYDPAAFGGDTKLVVARSPAGWDTWTGQRLYTYEVVRDFAILGGTSTNCAGGTRHPHTWLTCEEVVKRTNGRKHGYIFEIDARADGPVAAIPVRQTGRRAHEAALVSAGIVYMTEDRRILPDPFSPDPVNKLYGACFYRYIATPRGGGVPLAETRGRLQALKIRGEFHANMDVGRAVGVSYPVEWIDVENPDHDDDTDMRLDREPGLTPNRVQAQDDGAAFFDRQEGMWAGPGDAKIYFDCTTGGPADLGQVWEYDPGRETITLIYESSSPDALKNPDNIVIVPQTKDIFLCEDSDANQYIRGLTRDGKIYNFCKAGDNDSEFAGACFDPDGQTLYVNQMGEFPSNNDPLREAVTYAIYGPFEKRAGNNNR
jgi:secreted PhoX family phosphatase